MLNSAILETAIGIVFVYLVFSLIASAIAEYISSWFDRRSDHLKHTLFNLFDNDDPQGRTMFNLFVGHPMVQALNSETWKPKFQSAAERIGDAEQEFKVVKSKWWAASRAVTAADNATETASKAEQAATWATNAAAAVKAAQGVADQSKLAEAVGAAEAAVTTAQTAAAAAEAASSDADRAAQDVAKVKARNADPAAIIALASTSQVTKQDQPQPPKSSEAPSQVSPIAAAPSPQPKAAAAATAAAADLPTRAKNVIDQAAKAAAAATEAAKKARKAATAAQKAKRGLDGDLTDCDVPKYIPDRIFTDVLVHVLTSDDTIRALSGEHSLEKSGTKAGADTITFWDRFGAALKVVGGVASRLPEGNAKNNVNRTIQLVDTSLAQAREGTAVATVVFGALEKGTNELFAAVAAVPDDTLRSALEREIQTSLRPLHALGRDILLLERAGLSIAVMADSSIKTALKAFHMQAGEDLNAFKQSVSNWFNDVMDHASGWYKRNTQVILIGIAIALCTLNNVDTVAIVGHLSSSTEMRSAAAAQARAFLPSAEDAQIDPALNSAVAKLTDEERANLAERYKQVLEDTKLPLWWTATEWNNLWFAIKDIKQEASSAPGAVKSAAAATDGGAPTMSVEAAKARQPEALRHVDSHTGRFSIQFTLILAKLTGLSISIMAVSMGAPFWFDVLNKLVNIRLTGKRPVPTTFAPADDTTPAQPPRPTT
jgi:hypothetical protein